MNNKGKRYHYDNIYTFPLPLQLIELVQVGEIITQGDYVIDSHEQICSEISYVVSGECNFYTDDKVFHAKKGDVHVIGPGTKHKIVARTEDDLRMAYMAFHFRETGDMMEAKEFFHKGAMFLKNDQMHLKTIFDGILFELHMGQVYSNKILDAYTTQLLVQVYRLFHLETSEDVCLTKDDFRKNYIMGRAVFQTLRYIDNNVEEVGNIQQIAEQLKYNPTYLSRIFSEQMGVTLSDYIKIKKIERAKEILKQGISVDEVAQRLGYFTTQSFSKMFRRYEKCSPSAYKRENIK